MQAMTMKGFWPVSLFLLLGLVQGAAAATSSDDLVALLQIKASLDPSPLLQNWTVTGDPCAEKWRGIVACTNGTTQRVTNLQLQNSNLSGSLSPYIGNLTALTWLDMSSNRLSGPIPTTFADLVNITRINLHSNLQTGTLQPFVSLRTMDFLNVGDNLISGVIPPEFNNLTKLGYFSIGQNPITGTIPDLSNMANIVHLHFDGMNLTGPLPAGLSRLSKMIHLVVQNNALSGPLPTSYSALSSIKVIQLDNNFFSGTLPPSYSNLSTLVDFRAVNNQLSGPIDPSWLQLPNLRKLDLSYNTFSGDVPPGLGDMPKLIDVNLEHNVFSGAVPSSLCASTIMTTLRLNDNQFTGALPTPCFNLTNPPFQSAFFHNNLLTGEIPDSLDSSVGFTAFGNPWCSANLQLPACQVPPTAAAAPAPATSLALAPAPSAPLPQDCVCSSGQVPQPYTLSVQLLPNGSIPCTCIYPSQFVINLPGVSPFDLTRPRFERLALSIAATINLLPAQVVPEAACRASEPNCTEFCRFPPCTGTTAAFLLLPVQGQAIDGSYIRDLEFRLTEHGNISWFWNKIDDDFVPYTLVIARPATIIIIKEKASTTSIVIAVVAAVVGVLFLLAVCVAVALGLWCCRRRSKKYAAAPWLRGQTRTRYTGPGREGSGVPLTKDSSGGGSGWRAETRGASSTASATTREPFLNTQLRTYAFSELEAATENFSKERAIGSGGFGTVFRALFPDESEVAVKRLSLESKQGEPEFLAEIGAISQRLTHPNLLRLLGYCSHGRDRLLVYELMRRGDLRGYLRDGRKNPLAVLDWETRLNVACDSTAGLQYLHEGVAPPVVHRDIKTSNILLDDDFRAKISDFGLAKLYPEDDATHITTKVQGTYGYLAPDYATTGLLNTKSDVYSMGVVFLELFSGVVAVSATTLNSDVNSFLVPWARRNCDKAGFHKEVMDPALEGQCPPKAAKLFAALAVGMSSHDPDSRPTMSQVAYTLELIKKETGSAPPSRRVQQPLPIRGAHVPSVASSTGDGSTTSATSFDELLRVRRRERGATFRPFEPPEVSRDWSESLHSGQSSVPGSEATWVELSEGGSQVGSEAGRFPEHSTLWRPAPAGPVTEVRPEYFQGMGR